MTAFKDIRNLRDHYYATGFDDTYLDLIRALSLPTTPGRVADQLSRVNSDLEALFEGRVVQTKDEDQPFIFKEGNQKFFMYQMAEGVKKIGHLLTIGR